MTQLDCRPRQAMLKRVQQLGFMTDDLRLFMNTHKNSQEAFSALKRYIALERAAKQEYEKRYGSLTLEAVEKRDQYDWVSRPWPWQMEA